MYYVSIVMAVIFISFAQSQMNNNTMNASNLTDNSTISTTQVTPTYLETFDLTNDDHCAATIVQKLQFENYANDFESFRFEFVNGTCNNPTLWYSYYPIYYDGISSNFAFNMIFANDYGINISCRTNKLCSELEFCVSNNPITSITLNNSNNNTEATILEFQAVKTDYISSRRCYGINSNSNNNEFIALMSVLCGDYNFTTLLTEQEFVEDIMSNEIPQCGYKQNPYLWYIIDSIPTTTDDDIDVDTDEIETEPICTINHSDDNWITWIYFAISFILVSISLFFFMTRYVGIEISIKKWGAILMLFLSSLAIASIFRALITTFAVMIKYEKCNTLQSKAPLKPWDWEEDWEKDSLMGFWFWIIGVLISSGIYTVIMMIKFNMRSISQHQYGKIDCGDKFIGWCIKGVFFIVTFSFSAVLRPYYYVGEHSEWDTKCSCVDGNIALIAEIYGAALLSIILAPCAYKCGFHCLNGDDDDDDDEKDNWLTKIIGCMLLLYAAYCAFIVIAAPFLFIAFRIIEYIESAQELFTSDDFTMFIWFFEAVSNFFVDLTN